MFLLRDDLAAAVAVEPILDEGIHEAPQRVLALCGRFRPDAIFPSLQDQQIDLASVVFVARLLASAH